MKIPCRYAHVFRGFNADGDWLGFQQQASDQQARGSSSAGARSRSRSRLSGTRTGVRTPTPKRMPQPRDQQARGSSSAGARSRSPSPLSGCSTPTQEGWAPSPITIEALSLLGLDDKEVLANPRSIARNYRKEMLDCHPDKLEKILREKTQAINNAKQHLDEV